MVESYVPWHGPCADDVLLFDDGSFFAMLELQGVPWQTHDDEQLKERKLRLNQTFRQVAHESLILTVYQYRGPAPPDVYPDIQPRPGFATDLNIAYKAHLLDQRLYQNRIFLGVHIQPPSVVRVRNHFMRLKKSNNETDNDRFDRLEDTVALLTTELAAYRPHRLGMRVANRIHFNEIMEALHLVMTGVWRPIPHTTWTKAGDLLFDSHLDFEWDVLQFLMPGDEHVACMFGMQHFPAETHPLSFSRMLTCSYQCTVQHSFRFMPVTKSLEIINRKHYIRGRANDPSRSQTAGLKDLADAVASGKVVMGDYSCGILMFAPDLTALRKVSSLAWTDLAETGAKITREAPALKSSYFAMLPGNGHKQFRSGLINSRNMACLAPMQGFPTGPLRSHWGGPIALFRSIAGTPVYFHWQGEGSDVGNTLITGDTGSGKTTLIAFLLAMTTGRAKIIALDHKRGWEFLFRTMHGHYTVLGAGAPSFAPLKALKNTSRNRAFLFELLRGCILSGAPPDFELTPDEEFDLAQAIEMVMTETPPAERSMSEIRAFLGVRRDRAGARLEKWCRGNELGWVLDAETDALSLDGKLCGNDTTALLDNERAKGPALAYLTYRINLELDGTPTIIPFEEGWKVLNDPIFSPILDAQIRTIRSKNGIVVFITQGAEDITRSGLASVLIQQCPTQIHLPSPRATEDDYVDGLKRTKGEFAALKEIQQGSGLFLLCQGPDSTVAQLPLHGLDDIVGILSARESTIKAYDQALLENGGDVAKALATIHHVRQTEHVL